MHPTVYRTRVSASFTKLPRAIVSENDSRFVCLWLFRPHLAWCAAGRGRGSAGRGTAGRGSAGRPNSTIKSC